MCSMLTIKVPIAFLLVHYHIKYISSVLLLLTLTIYLPAEIICSLGIKVETDLH